MAHQLLATSILIAPAVPLAQNEPAFERLINGLAGIILLAIVGLCFIALIALLTVLLPNAGKLSRTALLQSPRRAFFIGLANYLFLGGISLALFSTQVEILGLVGLLIVAFLTVVTAVGLTGLVAIVGERLAGLHGGQMSPLKQLVWGTVAVELAGLLPFVGWFLLTPILLMVAFGAALLGWRARNQPPDELQEIEPVDDV